MRIDRAVIRFGLTAALTLGSLGLYTSTAIAGGSGWAQQARQPDGQVREDRRARREERQQRPQAAPPQQQRPQFEQRRQQAEQQPRFERRQQAEQQRPQFDRQRPQQADQQRQQNNRFRAQQDQRQQFDRPGRWQADQQRQWGDQRQQFDYQRRQQADQQRQQNDRFRARPDRGQQDRRQYGQRPDDRRPADWRNNDRSGRYDAQRDNRRDPRGNWDRQAPRRDDWHGGDRHYRGPGWDRWRARYYVSAPRYHWSYDRHSRPWFDYNRVTYISIYRPTYVIPYNAYESYGTSYYGPIGCNRDVVGAVLGGVAGGLIGAHNGGGGATVGGAIIGALLGGALGQAIDLSDQACYGQVLEYAPSNQPVYWESAGAQYQVTPLRTYQNGSGEYCREYQTYIYIDGQEEQAYGTACRQPDGAWRAS